MQEVIRKFSQPWPVFDFSFRLATPAELEQVHNLDNTLGMYYVYGRGGGVVVNLWLERKNTFRALEF